MLSLFSRLIYSKCQSKCMCVFQWPSMWKGSSSWAEEAWAPGFVWVESRSTGAAATRHQMGLSTAWMGWNTLWRWRKWLFICPSQNTFNDWVQLTDRFLALIQMQIFCYDPDDFKSLDDAIREGGRVSALAVLFEVGPRVGLWISVFFGDQSVPPQSGACLWDPQWNTCVLVRRSALKTMRTSILW